MNGKYDELIKKIKKRKNIITVLFAIAVFATVFFLSPSEIVILDQPIIDHKGNPVAMIFIILFEIIAYFIAVSFALGQMTTSMITECNPEKHLVLNIALNKSKNKNAIFSMDYFYLGDFRLGLEFANKMLSDKHKNALLLGLLFKARCEFFLNDFESLKETVNRRRAEILKLKNAKQPLTESQKVLELLVAVAEQDKQKIKDLANVKPWDNAKPAQGFTDYVKALAAICLEDYKEAVYRLKRTQELLDKSAFYNLASEKLSELNLQ